MSVIATAFSVTTTFSGVKSPSNAELGSAFFDFASTFLAPLRITFTDRSSKPSSTQLLHSDSRLDISAVPSNGSGMSAVAL